MLLAEAKASIDAGQTAKLVIPSTQASGPDTTVRIAKQGNGYTWQRGSIQGRKVLHAGPNTKNFETWQDLTEGITGMQTTSNDWMTCDDALEGIAGRQGT